MLIPCCYSMLLIIKLSFLKNENTEIINHSVQAHMNIKLVFYNITVVMYDCKQAGECLFSDEACGSITGCSQRILC